MVKHIQVVSKKMFKYSLAILILFHCSNIKAQILDQSQLVYTGGMSARTLAGYSEWQSFTAGLTGTLTEIKMGFFNYISGVGTLKVFSGTGTGGTLLQSKSVAVSCASGNCMIGFPVSVPSIAGQVYTFQFIPGSGIPDPYGVQVQMTGSYPGGYMGLVDPSGTTPLTFDMVFQTYVNTAFPVKLISFTGENQHNISHLKWSTASESNNQYFTIERSVDGSNFTPIGTVAGAGNSDRIITYEFDDKAPKCGTNYYRLMQTDINGASSHSPVISIKNKPLNIEFSIYPNPVRQVLNSSFFSEYNSEIRMSITSTVGKTLFTKTLQAVPGNNKLEMNTSNLSPGFYLLNIETAGNNFQYKFIKM